MPPPLATQLRCGVPSISLTDVAVLARTSWTTEALSSRLLESLPVATWPASNGHYTEHLEAQPLATCGAELVVELRRVVDFAGANPAFDAPWRLVISYTVTLPTAPDAPPLWSERFSRVE